MHSGTQQHTAAHGQRKTQQHLLQCSRQMFSKEQQPLLQHSLPYGRRGRKNEGWDKLQPGGAFPGGKSQQHQQGEGAIFA
ncbi:hypothetical protein D3C84_1226190 [compost metagenome]